MLQLFLSRLITKLTDWLIVVFFVSLILWFAITLPTFSLFNSSAEPVALTVDQKQLKRHVDVLVNFYAPRTIEYGSLNMTARYIHKQLEKFGTTHYQPYWTMGGRYSNVILNLGPDSKEILVIGAHYDGKDDSLDSDANASGVATLIELARQLSLHQDQLSIGIQLVAYPLSQKQSVSIDNMGSYQHARSLSLSKKQVKLMVSLDNVGTFTDQKESQSYPYQFMHYVYPDEGNYISLLGRIQDYSELMQFKKSFSHASELPLYSFNLPESYFPINSSDHLNYQRFGAAAMVVTDTAEYRKQENTGKEMLERLDYQRMAMLVQGLYQVVMDQKSPLQPIAMLHKTTMIK